MLIVHSYEFFSNTWQLFWGVRPLDMAPVEQLGDDGRWYEQLSAIWHWYLPLSIYITFFLFCIHPFLFYTFL